MECKECPKLRWPMNPGITRNYCMRDKKPRLIKDRDTELTGCNIDGVLVPPRGGNDE